MDLSNFWVEDNTILANRLLECFEKSSIKISYFNLWYRVSKFFWKDLELFSYKNYKKDFLFYKDKAWLDNHISIYNASDKTDWSTWIVFEIIIWESWKKDILFFSENKMYNVTENKRWKIINSSIIEDVKKIWNILSFIEKDIKYVTNKTAKYQSKLRQRWILNKQIRQSQIDKFKINFNENILNLA